VLFVFVAMDLSQIGTSMELLMPLLDGVLNFQVLIFDAVFFIVIQIEKDL
jgi:hypothetical protein